MEKNVKVYSTQSCPHCVRAKEYLTNNNITFDTIDVSQNEQAAQEMIDKSGQMGVPVLDIDGTIVVGFDKSKINQALGLGN